MIVFKKSQQSRLWTNHKGTDEKGVQVDNTHLGFKVMGCHKILGMHVIFHQRISYYSQAH